jgi:hypothetical protein
MKSFAFSVNQDWEAGTPQRPRGGAARRSDLGEAFAVLPSQLNKTGSSSRGAGPRATRFFGVALAYAARSRDMGAHV